MILQSKDLDKVNMTMLARSSIMAERLQLLKERLQQKDTAENRFSILEQTPEYQSFLIANRWLQKMNSSLPISAKAALAAVVVLGQEQRIFGEGSIAEEEKIAWDAMVRHLSEADEFYGTLGGLVGYHYTFTQLCEKELLSAPIHDEIASFHMPFAYSVSDEKLADEAIVCGLKNLEQLGEIYVVGGAAERLHFADISGKPLPAAHYPFEGKTLLQGLICDLQALEFLYFLLENKICITPLAMMTSSKENDDAIKEACMASEWFNRPPGSIQLFCQPMAPVISEEGCWMADGKFQPALRPGGHGVLWKLAEKRGVLDWFKQLKRRKLLIRQINNPLGGIDSGILSFIGVGFKYNKEFGLITCPRMEGAAEGVIALAAIEKEGKTLYFHSNIEYTRWKKRKSERPSDDLPANTNILFVDISAVEKAVEKIPFPGLLINLKAKYEEVDAEGTLYTVRAGRLESTMQNISDAIVTEGSESFEALDQKAMKSFVVTNRREKTLSVAKKAFKDASENFETPQRAFYDLLAARYELLQKCHFSLPKQRDLGSYFAEGPSFVFSYHPALGPLFSIIAEKLYGGKIAEGSELKLEISELYVENLDLSGSLLVIAKCPMGHLEAAEKGSQLKYNRYGGYCSLRNVTIKNKGYDKKTHREFWKGTISRVEHVEIVLEGFSEFIAENVEFEGSYRIDVPDGFRYTAYRDEAGISMRKERISVPSWQWSYSYSSERGAPIALKRIVNSSQEVTCE
jgi:hypothetical protein